MNNFKLTILNFLYRISRPTHWVKLGSYDRNLDLFLLKKINEGAKVEFIGSCVASLDGVEIWVANYPYSYGHLYYETAHCGSYVAVQLRKYLSSKTYEGL